MFLMTYLLFQMCDCKIEYFNIFLNMVKLEAWITIGKNVEGV